MPEGEDAVTVKPLIVRHTQGGPVTGGGHPVVLTGGTGPGLTPDTPGRVCLVGPCLRGTTLPVSLGSPRVEVFSSRPLFPLDWCLDPPCSTRDPHSHLPPPLSLPRQQE